MPIGIDLELVRNTLLKIVTHFSHSGVMVEHVALVADELVKANAVLEL